MKVELRKENEKKEVVAVDAIDVISDYVILCTKETTQLETFMELAIKYGGWFCRNCSGWLSVDIPHEYIKEIDNRE